ncbi:hypothetical protein GYMLUDRAFT_77111 [Collybiopsis luxurians FD-317 M1]|uniref:F-box domain-containing protein n=1 Tax=Collybiopsis luxurians FD-317 M1 TaxID=944289 RepID=A0A0D0CHJ9_9AGAR|nr:hypothetical protein GYMLUDRAFT_77111 [Collybiopsis luxurians FD-317 M1]
MADNLVPNTNSIRDIEEWSSPERRRGNQQLDPIPNEIYLEIISGIHSRKDLDNLVLTCRFFASVIIPNRFSAIYFADFDHPETAQIASHLKLLKAIRETSDRRAVSLLKYTRYLEIEFAGSASTSFQRFCEDILLKSPNIKDLNVYDLHSPSLFKNISELSNLSSLGLYSLSPSVIYDVTDADIISCASALRLESLSLYIRNDGSSTERHQHMEAKFVPLTTIPHLKTLKTYSWPVICGLASQGTLPPYQKLEVGEVEDLLLLYNLVCRIPTLTTLDLNGVRLPENAQIATPLLSASLSLSLSPLSNLRTLVMPPHLAYIFAGPHSLREIVLLGALKFDVQSRGLQFSYNHQVSADIRLLFDHPCIDVERIDHLPCATVRPGGPGYKNMRRCLPKLKYLSLRVNVDIEGYHYYNAEYKKHSENVRLM